MIFWLVLKLEISYRIIIISRRILVSFRGFFEVFFFHVEIFHNSSFCLQILFYCKWQGHTV
jgi:hypothetical protein